MFDKNVEKNHIETFRSTLVYIFAFGSTRVWFIVDKNVLWKKSTPYTITKRFVFEVSLFLIIQDTVKPFFVFGEKNNVFSSEYPENLGNPSAA